MGVLENNRNQEQDLLIEECMLIEDSDLSKETQKNEGEKQKNRKRNPAPSEYVKAGGRKARGSRCSRRSDNYNFLLSLVENEEYGELSIRDFVEPSVSVFSELFMEQEKMQAWNDFINRAEEDQRKFLFRTSNVNEKSKETLNTKGWETDKEIDNRGDHPAFSAQDCFKRVETKFRHVLLQRHMPKGTLAHLEEELMSFFQDWPDSVYVSNISNSYERLLLHALCQYLDLHSQSFMNGCIRQTEVENPHDYFSPPQACLSSYLEEKSKRH